MKNFKKHFDTLKEILLDSDSEPQVLMKKYDREIQSVTSDTNLMDFEDADGDIINAISYKIPRIKGWHPNYYRDTDTNLTLGKNGFSIWDYNDPWEKASDDQIYKPIQNHITPLFYAGGKGSWDMPMVNDTPKCLLEQEDMQKFVGDLTESTHMIVNYIRDNVKRDWAWRKDLYAFSIYTFEFFYEYVYNLINKKGETTLSDFNPSALHSFPIKNLPLKAEHHMLTKEDRLNDILDSTFDFIEMNEYHLSRNPIWIRSILFQVGLTSLKVVLESDIK